MNNQLQYLHTQRQAKDLGKKLAKGLQGTGSVPCRFERSQPCQAMRDDKKNVVWSQSCIAIMEKSPEYMNLLQVARELLELPAGEWVFPAPAGAPHYSLYYGHTALQDHGVSVKAPPDFQATEAGLYLTTPGTVPGVSQWQSIAHISLV